MEETFRKLSIDFYLIGAIARDIWYAKGNAVSTGTRDVDFAIFISNQNDYETLKNYLVKEKNFVESKTNDFVVISSEGHTVDLLPFGEIEIDSKINIAGGGLTSIQANGFKEVYESGIATIELEIGHAFQVATLPAIVLLKLISYDDRPEQRFKDPRDIAGIIQHYFDLQSDNIYENHSDLFEFENFTIQKAGARVIGREIKTIIGSNALLKERITGILTEHIYQAEKSVFIRNMQTGDNFVLSVAMDWLNEIQKGITE